MILNIASIFAIESNYQTIINHIDLSKRSCQEFIQYAKTEMNTTGLIIRRGDQKIFEMYGNGANAKTKNRMWSISKTLSGIMLGAKVNQYGMGLLDKKLIDIGINRAVLDNDTKKTWNKVAVRNVWNMSSGINWCEYGNCRTVDAASMMYGKGQEDTLKYVLSQPLTHNPGEYYRYSAGNFILLQTVLKKLASSYEEYLMSPYEDVLKRIGVDRSDYAFEVDGKGLILGGSGLLLTTDAMARIGQLLLNQGSWGEDKILSSAFYKEMTTNSEAIKNSPFAVQNWEGPAGGSIWLNDDSRFGDGQDRDGIPSFMPTSPRDMIYAGGNFGQFLLIYPSSDLVVARTGGDMGHAVHWKPFSEKALNCLDPAALRKDLVPLEEKKAPDTGKNLSLARILRENIILNSRAQEVCSCFFVSGFKDLETCDKNVPSKQDLALSLNSHNIIRKPVIDFEKGEVRVRSRVGLQLAVSTFDFDRPYLGCTLKQGAEKNSGNPFSWNPQGS